MSNRRYLFLFIFLGTLSLAVVSANVWMLFGDRIAGISIIETVSAAEIDSMFFCPCCQNPLDKENICCGQAQERIDYIDLLISKNFSKKEIISDYVKKFGIDSFVDEAQEQEFKKELEKTAPLDRPIISLDKSYIDLGDISQKNGIANAFFEIKNTGRTDLVISKMDTSCGCTSSTITFDGIEGPSFSMDMPMPGQPENPTDWSIAIPAGKTAQLKVYYDPNVHKDLKGPVTREVSIYSNDPVNSKIKVQIDLNQVD
ncbi:MAG: DUF1573 domain-containing protein [Candidatus Staskawiczbacteria bacterium]|nr:DUF1573 domain-containing protein [Candidatus Staskawiczbacteria bacterium]